MTSTVETSTPPAPSPEDGIAGRLRALRERYKLSQTQFHQRTKEADPEGKGISRTVLIGYESGKFKPGARELRILCAAFNVGPGWLLLGSDGNGEDDLEGLKAGLFGGLGEPDLADVFRLALGLAALKPHEREAIGSLVHSLSNARRGAPSAEAINWLAEAMALDAELRLVELTEDRDAAKRLRTFKGKTLIEHFRKLYDTAYAAQWHERSR